MAPQEPTDGRWPPTDHHWQQSDFSGLGNADEKPMKFGCGRVPSTGTSKISSRCLGLTTRPERFRVKAIECHVAAQKTQDLATKEAYLELVRLLARACRRN